ncbi:MAG TPA: hypothetical protein IAD07_04580 [Candidatus Fimivicinus intestinavium]|nr:hypothetical protein [Candidatus Fimivicinus intestinavium]
MKRSFCLILACVTCALALTACQKEGPVITGNDGVTYEQVVDGDGNPVTDSSGNPVVVAPKHTDEAGNVQEGSTQSLTIPYISASGNALETPGYRMEIPEDWERKNDSVNPLLENKEETLQISIMDKGTQAGDRESYAETARNSLLSVGNEPSEISETTIAGCPASKFTCAVSTEQNVTLEAVFYIVEKDGRLFVLSGAAKDAESFEAAGFDAIFNTIQFK